MHDGIYERGDVFACSDGEYWVEESDERLRMLGVIPVYMSAGNHGYWIDEDRQSDSVSFSLLELTPNWYIEMHKKPPQLKPPDDPEALGRTTNLA